MMYDLLVFRFSVKREFRKLFFGTRDLKRGEPKQRLCVSFISESQFPSLVIVDSICWFRAF